MEALLKHCLKENLSPYLIGVDKTLNESKDYPVEMKNLQLDLQEINRELHGTGITLTSGKVGYASINPSNYKDNGVEVSVDKVNFTFKLGNPSKDRIALGRREERRGIDRTYRGDRHDYLPRNRFDHQDDFYRRDYRSPPMYDDVRRNNLYPDYETSRDYRNGYDSSYGPPDPYFGDRQYTDGYREENTDYFNRFLNMLYW